MFGSYLQNLRDHKTTYPSALHVRVNRMSRGVGLSLFRSTVSSILENTGKWFSVKRVWRDRKLVETVFISKISTHLHTFAPVNSNCEWRETFDKPCMFKPIRSVCWMNIISFITSMLLENERGIIRFGLNSRSVLINL